MTTRASVPRLLAAAATLGALALSGCGAGDPAAEETSPAPSASAGQTTAEAEPTPEDSESASAEPSESSEPSPSESASESPEASPTAAAADGVCTSDMLSAVLETEMGGGAAGSVYRQIIFTNTADEQCEITGYPGVSYVDAAGNQVGAPADREPAQSSEVVLAPGESAVAPVKQTNAQNYGADCLLTDTVGLRVYPPNDTASLIVDQTGTACASEDIVLMTVAPTKPLSP
ncbi:Protein of unknown function [Arthrobacter subterraneus]|uniref:DUF4232 domain-containing protein n=1 Tax=Arthrobacter subterraneus TaxID=335973 RepID=A0A1G8KJ54_9MICC|nr:DUF4232 domain-containing protein [Arthrobacter subterraneus]SDI43415.1 Protein of unknown function [Arthrobacter subterraneus]